MNRKIRSIIALIAALLLMTSTLAACSAKGSGSGAQADDQVQQDEEPAAETDAAEGADTLAIYFSATGNTRGIAEKIAAVEGAGICEIVPEVPYTAEDLDYGDETTRATAEQHDPDARPAIGGEDIDLAGYRTVFIGYPIWWGEEPRIMDTFAETHDFTGLTVIPFCTSGSSGIGTSGSALAELAGTGTWLEGARFAADASEADIRSWIDSLGL